MEKIIQERKTKKKSKKECKEKKPKKEKKEKKDKEHFYKNLICDGCDTHGIKGTLYHCYICDDFDFC